MKTKVVKIDQENIDNIAINEAAQIIKSGGLVALPTETVYGLGANALDPVAIKKIFDAKGRPQDNPLIIHIDDVEWVDRLCSDVSDEARTLMRAFWPGPLTLIMRKKDIVPDIVTCGLETAAIRYPSNKIARALIKASGVPIAAPSANLSGRPSPTTAAHVIEDMNGRIEMIIDGSECDIGLESTVVDVSEKVPMLLRPGGITLEQLRAVCPGTLLDKTASRPLDIGEKPKSPGMKYRHYAPRAKVIIVDGKMDDVIAYIKEKITPATKKTGVLCYNEYVDCFKGAFVIPFGSVTDVESQARGLFDSLRSFDNTSVEVIFAQCPEKYGIGLAVANRLTKAAGFNIIEV